MLKGKVEECSKVCGVCGDKALGFNFNAITCESCKAFFRRNALVPKALKCPFSDNCDITTVTRRFCQKCRLDKCFKIGMCKDLIMTEEDKVKKRMKIEENRAKKRETNDFPGSAGGKKVKRECLEEGSLEGNSISDSDSKEADSTYGHFSVIRSMLSPREASPVIYSPVYDMTADVVENVQKVSSSAGPSSIESILCEAIKLEFEAYSSIPQCNSNSRELNDAERAKLNELIVANKALLSPMDKDINSLTKINQSPQPPEADPALVDVINLTATVIRRLIKMAKKINAFKNMCQEDQVALLKGGCTEIMILRSSMNYDPTKQTWKIPHSQETFNLNVDILKLAKGNIYQEHQRFIKTFDPKWRSDENIVLILCAIVLFTPARPRVIHQDVIKLEQNSYYYLLRRYLESIYAGCEAKSIFLKLIQKIAELHKLNEELINVYLDVNPSQVEPLLIELFDIKHR